MPLVIVRYNKEKFSEIDILQEVLKELVPALYNISWVPGGRLTPGCVRLRVTSFSPNEDMNCDVFIEAEGEYLEERLWAIRDGVNVMPLMLMRLFPETTFVYWQKLVDYPISSDVPDPKFIGEMSVEASFLRAEALVAKAREASCAN